MAKGAFRINRDPAALPIEPDDLLWFGRKLTENGVNTRSQIGPAIEAARDLAIVAHARRLLAKKFPQQRVVAEMPAGFDIGLATSSTLMIRSLRHATSWNPDLLDGAWHLLARGSPLSVPQQRTSGRDQIWEILNGAVYSHFAGDVRLNSGGTGVDLWGEFMRSAWGIECKVLYTGSNDRRIDRIIEGVKQLEADERVERGVVAVNVTDCLDHAGFQQSLVHLGPAFSSDQEPILTLSAAVRGVALESLTGTLRRRLLGDGRGKPRRKCRAVIYVGQAICLVSGQVKVFTSQFTALRPAADDLDRRFAYLYHDGWLRLQAA